MIESENNRNVGHDDFEWKMKTTHFSINYCYFQVMIAGGGGGHELASLISFSSCILKMNWIHETESSWKIFSTLNFNLMNEYEKLETHLESSAWITELTKKNIHEILYCLSIVWKSTCHSFQSIPQSRGIFSFSFTYPLFICEAKLMRMEPS